jgi:hypothetical protein
VLRLLDEMTETERENRAQGHLLSTQILTLLRREHNPSTATLRAVILRIALRQEILISFMSRRPLQEEHIIDDWMWAFRMIACAGEVLD